MISLKFVAGVLALMAMADAVMYSESEEQLIRKTEIDIMKCIHGRSSSKSTFCTNYLRRMEKHQRKRRSTSQSEKPFDDTDAFGNEQVKRMNLPSSYGLSDRVMREVTCSRYMKPVMEKWSRLLSPKFDLDHRKELLIKPKARTVFDNNKASDVTFTLKSGIDDVEGVSLYVNRKSSLEMGEAFGRYRVTVHQLDANNQQITPALYDGIELSCPTHDAKFITIPLENIESVLGWLSDAGTNLNLRVRIQPQRQEFYNDQDVDEQGILLNVTFLSLLQRGSSDSNDIRLSAIEFLNKAQRIQDEQADASDYDEDEEEEEYENEEHEEEEDEEEETLHRERRSRSSQRSRRQPCQKVSYVMDFNFYRDAWNVRYPDKYDIHECGGRCSFPLTSHMNTTNHAISIKTDMMSNEDHPDTGSVHCVPISYKAFHYLRYSPQEYLEPAHLDDVEVESCGCR